jgi:hypothetical protein
VLHSYLLGAVVGGRSAEFGLLSCATVDERDGARNLSLGNRLNAGALIRDGGQELFKSLPNRANNKFVVFVSTGPAPAPRAHSKVSAQPATTGASADGSTKRCLSASSNAWTASLSR